MTPTPQWLNDPEVQALLADCAQTPPSRRWTHVKDTLDGGKVMGWRYSRRDARVKRLHEIAEAAFLEACNISLDEARACPEAAEAITAAIAEAGPPHMADAIDAAILTAPKGRLAVEALRLIEMGEAA